MICYIPNFPIISSIYPVTLTRSPATVPPFMLLGIHCLRFVVGFFDALRLVCFVFFVAFSSTLGSILVAFGLLFGTFLSTLGVPGRSRGAFGHPWAPKAQKTRKRSPKTPNPSPHFEHFSRLFAKKRVFLRFFFLDAFFNRFLDAPGPP